MKIEHFGFPCRILNVDDLSGGYMKTTEINWNAAVEILGANLEKQEWCQCSTTKIAWGYWRKVDSHP